MGLIKEPKDVDFFVDPTPLTSEQKKMLSEAIAYYKATGRIKMYRAGAAKKRSHVKRKRKIAA